MLETSEIGQLNFIFSMPAKKMNVGQNVEPLKQASVNVLFFIYAIIIQRIGQALENTSA